MVNPRNSIRSAIWLRSVHAARTLSASTEARTSWTRTPHAPCRPARAEITAVAVSRPSGGRGSPSAPASNVPRNRLRDAPTSTGIPVPTSSGSARSSAQLCSPVLANPRPGSMIRLAGSTPAATAASTAGEQLVAHFGDHVAVGRRVVRAGGGDRAPVHQHPRHLGVGEQRRHVRVGTATGHVVDDPRAVLQRRLRHLCVHGVDAHRKSLARQAL